MRAKAPILLNIDHPSLNVRDTPDILVLRAPSRVGYLSDALEGAE